MARRKRLPRYSMLVTLTQAIVCAGSMLVGVTLGAVIISVSALWRTLDRVLTAPTESVLLPDLGLALVTFAIVLVCAWIGIRCGMALAQNIGE